MNDAEMVMKIAESAVGEDKLKYAVIIIAKKNDDDKIDVETCVVMTDPNDSRSILDDFKTLAGKMADRLMEILISKMRGETK